MKIFYYLLLSIVFTFGCSSKSGKEYKIENNITDASDQIHDLTLKTFIDKSFLYVVNDYLLVLEPMPQKNKSIHLIDLNSLSYKASGGFMGEGPGELIRPGRVGVDEKNNLAWIPDFGKMNLVPFSLDSIMADSVYRPLSYVRMKPELFIERFGLINDSIALGKAVAPSSRSTFIMDMVKLNLNSGDIQKFGYVNPQVSEKHTNSLFALSLTNKRYANVYIEENLITICDLDGNLISDVHGEEIKLEKGATTAYFSGVDFYMNYILASYIGGDDTIINEFQRQAGNSPSKILIFDVNGNYIKAIEVGNKFYYFCVDEVHNRLFFYFIDRENPIGYLNLDQLLNESK